MKIRNFALALSVVLCGCSAAEGTITTPAEFSRMPLSEKFDRYASRRSGMGMPAGSLVQRVYESQQEIADDSTDVIVGVVTEIEPECHNGFIGSICTVEVQEVIRGDLEAGDVICIPKLQGVATADQLAESFDNEADRKKMLGENTGNEDILFVNLPANELLTDIGQKSLYFLKKPDTEEGRYGLTSGSSSEFLALENGTYVPVREVATAIGGDYLTVESIEKMNQMEWDSAIESEVFAE